MYDCIPNTLAASTLRSRSWATVVRATDELELQLIGWQQRLERLQGRKVAAGVVAHAHLAAAQIFGFADG
jgi:hypothetical protein